MGVLLLIIAVILGVILLPIGWAYSLMTFRAKGRRLNSYARAIAISIDRLGNVVLCNLFNDVLITSNGYKFGSDRETISAVLGANRIKGTLTKTGLFIANTLDRIEKDHCELAFQKEIGRINLYTNE